MDVTPLLVTQAQAATMLAVSATTVWRLYRAGELTPVKIGSKTLIRLDSIHRLVDGVGANDTLDAEGR